MLETAQLEREQVIAQATVQAEQLTRSTRTQKLNAMIQLMQQGRSPAQALRESGILGPETSNQYDPSNPDEELAIEELYYKRCGSRSKVCLADSEYQLLDSVQREQHRRNGDLNAQQLFKLVDWLYYTKGLPLTAIATSLRVDPKIVARVKAELSNEFAKTIRLQSAEGYIADLLRCKELLRADLLMRKEKLGAAHPQQVALTRLLWDIENDFIDRLQEIGIIDKNLGKLDVHEEWHVSIGPAGQPVNQKLKEISTSLASDDDALDADFRKIIAVPVATVLDEPNASATASHLPEHGAATPLPYDEKMRATIQVGQPE